MAKKTGTEIKTLDEENQLLSVAEVADLLRVGRTKCYQLIAEGRLQSVSLGERCTRVRASSVRRLINGEGGE